jgi:hypothetical protein
MARGRVTVVANDDIGGIGDRVDEGSVDDSRAAGHRELAANANPGACGRGI